MVYMHVQNNEPVMSLRFESSDQDYNIKCIKANDAFLVELIKEDKRAEKIRRLIYAKKCKAELERREAITRSKYTNNYVVTPEHFSAIKCIIDRTRLKHDVQEADFYALRRAPKYYNCRLEAIRTVASIYPFSYSKLGLIFKRDHASILRALKGHPRATIMPSHLSMAALSQDAPNIFKKGVTRIMGTNKSAGDGGYIDDEMQAEIDLIIKDVLDEYGLTINFFTLSTTKKGSPEREMVLECRDKAIIEVGCKYMLSKDIMAKLFKTNDSVIRKALQGFGVKRKQVKNMARA